MTVASSCTLKESLVLLALIGCNSSTHSRLNSRSRASATHDTSSRVSRANSDSGANARPPADGVLFGGSDRNCIIRAGGAFCWTAEATRWTQLQIGTQLASAHIFETGVCVRDTRNMVTCLRGQPGSNFRSVYRHALPVQWMLGSRKRVCFGGSTITCVGWYPCSGRSVWEDSYTAGSLPGTLIETVGDMMMCGRLDQNLVCFGRDDVGALSDRVESGGCTYGTINISRCSLAHAEAEGVCCFAPDSTDYRCFGYGPWSRRDPSRGPEMTTISLAAPVRQIVSNETVFCVLMVGGHVSCHSRSGSDNLLAIEFPGLVVGSVSISEDELCLLHDDVVSCVSVSLLRQSSRVSLQMMRRVGF